VESIPSYRLYREKTDESGDFWIHCETIPERTHLHNWEIARHRHDSFFQIFYLSQGEGELTGLDTVRRLSAPCVIFIPAGVVHGFRYSRDIDGLVVTALGDRLRPIAAGDRQVGAFLNDMRVVGLDEADRQAAHVVDCIKRLHAEMHDHAPGRLLLLEPLLTQVLVGLVRASTVASSAAGIERTLDQSRLETLATLITANFRDHRPVGFYAAAIGISPAHLNRIARATTGHTVQGLIALHMTEAARRDLVFTPTPVHTIAYSLGFGDPAYFNRFFKRQTGVTPGAYRQAERRKLAA
jgi:AraC family transcriptional activator of pobA